MKHRRGASQYEAPDKLVRIARERTIEIMQAWTASLVWNAVDISILAESCYMQGVNDSADAMAQTGMLERRRIEGSYERER